MKPIIGVIIGALIHMAIAYGYMYWGTKVLERLFDLKEPLCLIILFILMVAHWTLFDGCCLFWIIDKPVAEYFGFTGFSHRQFSNTVIYKLFLTK